MHVNWLMEGVNIAQLLRNEGVPVITYYDENLSKLVRWDVQLHVLMLICI